MDSVRFGRALGIGARLAAKTAARTLVTAADAAAAPNPSSSTRTSKPPSSAPASTPRTAPTANSAGTRPAPASNVTARAARTVDGVRSTSAGIARGSRRFGEAVWGPVAKLSGVLWLELTGVFFGLFALSAGVAAWKLRAAIHPSTANPEAHSHLLLALAITALFSYFCLTSFLRANRRGRRP